MELRIEGALAPYLEVELAAGESLLAEPGSLLAKEPAVVMKAGLEGGFGAAFRRALAGTTLFLVEYAGPGHVTLTKGEPGRLLELVVDEGRPVYVTSGAFLCAERAVELKAGVASDARGLFWSQLPIVMLRLEGRGRSFVFARGDAKEVLLGTGESLEVAPGRIVWLEHGVTVAKASSLGVMDSIFGGVGLSLARITGPGRVCLQTRDVVSERKRSAAGTRKQRSEPTRRRPPGDDDVKEPWIWDGHRGD